MTRTGWDQELKPRAKTVTLTLTLQEAAACRTLLAEAVEAFKQADEYDHWTAESDLAGFPAKIAALKRSVKKIDHSFSAKGI